jgi:hypothetical protein
MPLPETVAALVERYAANRSEYRKGDYNETQTRIDYVNPLFAALGWDMDNHAGLSEMHREVIHEAKIKIGGTTKAPDYSFRAGGNRKLFVETKKPTVSLDLEQAPAYQIRRYGWTAKLPLSILTNFEEFAIYDTRVAPEQKDSAKTARLDYFKYTDYGEKWDELAARFSRNAVFSGAFDKYADEARARRITVPVDKAFLAEISGWRVTLAQNIVKNNPHLESRELNYAVQMIIDRIIFLRISEDRGVEPDHLLQPLMNRGGPVYPRLLDIFRHADARYNSGLFHFETEKGRDLPDDVTPHLMIDDRPLREIIASIYYPESPFEFSVFPADILGQVYEQFLGQVIHISGTTAEVQPKPEVKKAGGVYYTPTYIVDYITQNTVGKLVAGKTPAQVAKLTVLDPACGSGSFLIGAYQFLLDWHLKYYLDNGKAKWARGKNATIYQFKRTEDGGELWRLTTAEKRRILLSNIYGVDIDTQAVEVTKLSLLLKVLEGESAELINNTLSLYKERALPDLENNIKCGNSLIGPDFYDGKDMADFDLAAQLKLNAFNWNSAFPSVMKSGGFDAVIGNPPYIRIQTMKEWSPWDAAFYKAHYVSAGKGNYDIYVVFVEKGLSLLNKNGHLGFILPHKFFNSQYGQPLRKIISDGQHLEGVVHFGDQQVFENATTYTSLLFLGKALSREADIIKVNDLSAWRDNGTAINGMISASTLSEAEWNMSVGDGAELFAKLDEYTVKLRAVSKMFVGLQTSADRVFLFKNSKLSSNISTLTSVELNKPIEIESGLLKPVLRSGSIGRYWADATALVLFPYKMENKRSHLIAEAEMKKTYPKAWKYLNENKPLLSGREHGKFISTGWYQLYPKNLDVWEQPKIMIPYMVTRLAAYYDENSLFFVNVTTGGFGLTIREEFGTAKYVTGLLNSRLLDWFFRKVTTNFNSGYFGANKQYLAQLPIYAIDFAKPAEKAKHDKMVMLVEQMLQLHKDKAAARLVTEKNMRQQQIEATDAQIDRLVYDLYGLTDEEIKIVEGAG